MFCVCPAYEKAMTGKTSRLGGGDGAGVRGFMSIC